MIIEEKDFENFEKRSNGVFNKLTGNPVYTFDMLAEHDFTEEAENFMDNIGDITKVVDECLEGYDYEVGVPFDYGRRLLLRVWELIAERQEKLFIKTYRPIKILNPMTGEVAVTIPAGVPVVSGTSYDRIESWEDFMKAYKKDDNMSYDLTDFPVAMREADALGEVFPDLFADYEAIGLSNIENFMLG